MIQIRPLKALLANPALSSQIAALPYDVCNVAEARAYTHQAAHFYHITRSEIDMPEGVDVHSPEVYQKAKENLNRFIQNGNLSFDNEPAYFLYRLIMDGRSQTGLLCVSSVADYNEGKIKKHEFTRPEKEQDRIDHMMALGAQTGIVFLSYKDVQAMNQLVANEKNSQAAYFDFMAEDGVQHTVWRIANPEQVAAITQIFATQVPATYIADGHHRAASAAKVAAMHASNDAAQFFLTCIFPESELKILDYNRVVKDLNGNTVASFLEKLTVDFEITPATTSPYRPEKPNEFGLYLEQKWYKINAKPGTFDAEDPIQKLDVQILQNLVLSKVLDIHDPRTDARVEFVGGIRGLKELEKRVDSGEMAAAFSCFPVSLQQLFEVADSGKVMPPKSTWFEPKTRDGLVTYVFE